MRRLNYLLILFLTLFTNSVIAQNYGKFPNIKKDSLLLDFELLKQGLEKYHTGIYWYTPKDSFDIAFSRAKGQIDQDMNVLEFHKIIAPLVALTREDHTNIYLPEKTQNLILKNSNFLPLTVKFLGEKLYCIRNGSSYNTSEIEYQEIQSINGEIPIDIVAKIGSLFANDGFIKPVKLNDLSGFDFSRYYYLYYGNVKNFKVKFKGIEKPIYLKPLSIKDINSNLANNNHYEIKYYQTETKKIPFKFLTVSDSIAYLGIHTFNDDKIKENSDYKTLKRFLEQSFKTISEEKIKTLIIDVSENGGGNEGNEGLLYSYLGNNYQKYNEVNTKTQKAILDNGVDKPIKLKTFGLLERIFTTKKMSDGSLKRRNNSLGPGLVAYKNEPRDKFKGNKIYVIIGPITYSGGSEFANMVYSQGLATFVGQETGGSYYGNTSGYSHELVLPHSKIEIDIPALQFKMNVKDKIPFGRGIKPDYEIIPTIEQFKNKEKVGLNYILNKLIAN